jgi:hypothetical protein
MGAALLRLKVRICISALAGLGKLSRVGDNGARVASRFTFR